MMARGYSRHKGRNGHQRLAGVLAAVVAALCMVFAAAHAAGHDDGDDDALANCEICTVAHSVNLKLPVPEISIDALAIFVAVFPDSAGEVEPPSPFRQSTRSRGPPQDSPRL